MNARQRKWHSRPRAKHGTRPMNYGELLKFRALLAAEGQPTTKVDKKLARMHEEIVSVRGANP